MECDEEESQSHVTAPAETSTSAVNSLILDYYKKFGRKRDLEQYFSLSTAHSDAKDPSGTFWRSMKSENDSSDSAGKKSDSSQELCRISIRCSLPDQSSSQSQSKAKPKTVLTGQALLESLGIKVHALEEDSKTKSEPVSPPIITEEASEKSNHNSDDESVRSYDNNSQKSFDVLDNSTNKPLSPSSSITSQRKLEWDSLADVGYANESDRKASASSLSTLEKLALKQQYSNNDTKDSVLEAPTAHSTPLDDNDGKPKKKGVGKKSTKIYKKDVDYLEVNVPRSSENNPPQSISVNLTKHISFNVEKDGNVTIENVKKDVSVSPEKNNAEAYPKVKDKEMQTSLTKFNSSVKKPQTAQNIPVLISLNTLRRQTRRKKLKMMRRRLKTKKKVDKENIPVQEKSGEQLSEAESFEYMPGHIYNQNQLSANERSGNMAGNKSSLESSGLLTTDSSKGSKHSFTKDLEKSIDILRSALQHGGDYNHLRKQLIKQVCDKLLKSKYRDDESSTEFLSGLSFSSKKLGLGKGNNTTTSTSDNSAEKCKRPKKSILRSDKFYTGAIASTSQSAPNLPTATNSEKLVSSNLIKLLTTSNTDTDMSQKEKSSSDNVFAKTSSQELYQKYLDALKKEEAYKRHLKDKEIFLKQKLVCSDSAIKTLKPDLNVNNRLKDLIKDLTRNNYADGSGDASKLEGGPNSSREYDRLVPARGQRSHSVFTLSSGGNSDPNKKPNMKKRLQSDLKQYGKPGTSREHYCCCPHHSSKLKTSGIDSSVQVNIKHSCEPQSITPREKGYAAKQRLCDDQSCGLRNRSSRNECTSKGPPDTEPTCTQRSISPCGDPYCKKRSLSPRECSPRRIKESPRKIVADDSTGEIKYVCLCDNKNIQDVPDNFMLFKCSRLPKDKDEISSKSSNNSCRTRNVSPRQNKDSPNIPAQCSKNCTKNINHESICAMKTTNKSSQTSFLLKMQQRVSDESKSPSSCNSKQCSINTEFNKPSSIFSKVFEATRCLQTEISINPRIPEPSLSDINIVTECAILISEDFKRKSKSSLNDVSCRPAVNMETCCKSVSSKSSGTSKGIGELLDDEAFTNQVVYDGKQKTTQSSDSDHSEKFTIPIQGTNMTLMVSIGSNEKKPDGTMGQCVGTDKITVTEQGTCLAEECSKGVQIDHIPDINDHNSNYDETRKGTYKNNFVINDCLTTEEPTFNTYPKTSSVNEKKPLRRANTDDNFSNKCEPSISFNKNVSDKNSQQNECNVEDKLKCHCGCFGTIEQCKNSCNEKAKTEKCDTHPSYKMSVERETQYSAPASPTGRKRDVTVNNSVESNTCFCGCEGDKEKCSKNCVERKKSLIQEKQTSPRSCNNNQMIQISSNKITSRSSSEEKEVQISPRCTCGCNGNIEKCVKNCSKKHNLIKIVSSKEIGVQKNNSKEIGIQKDLSSSCSQTPSNSGRKVQGKRPQNKSNQASSSKYHCGGDSDRPSDKCISESETEKEVDPILDMIKNITKKYTKKDVEKNKRKKCFKEIMTVLNYLLEIEDASNHTQDNCIVSEGSTTPIEETEKKSPRLPRKTEKPSQKFKTKPSTTESSDCPHSTDIPATSSDSTACKVLNKIKKECERYHQKRCKVHNGKKCDISSSSSVNCEQCKRTHHCSCRNHKCKNHKKCEKNQKKSVAYNLILQSESISEETVCDQKRSLKNIVVKVPKTNCPNVPFKEMCAKIESRMPSCKPRDINLCRSRSLPNDSDVSTMEEFLKKTQEACTVREYLEQNRPDFIAKSSQRQTCMRIISDSRNQDPCCPTPQLKMIVVHSPNCTGCCNNMYQCQTDAPVTSGSQCNEPCAQNKVTKIGEFQSNMRATQRDFLSMRLAQLSDVENLDSEEVRRLAKDLGRHLRQKQPAPKFISEHEMKKHSENIYKSLPEVVRKKEEARKENIKKTNLLMADIFKRNLQKKTLRGSVDISNYSPVIKI